MVGTLLIYEPKSITELNTIIDKGYRFTIEKEEIDDESSNDDFYLEVTDDYYIIK